MNKIVSVEQAIKMSEEMREKGKKVVLVGGCFDILHIGHITFLKNAKKQGDVLIVMVEHDKTVQKLKGENRPVNSQEDRIEVLSALSCVDYILPLEAYPSDADYDELTKKIKPAIIATTQNDPARIHKERQAEMVGAKVKDVTGQISNQSTSRIVALLKESI